MGALLVVLLAVPGCALLEVGGSAPSITPTADQVDAAAALLLLETVPVKGRSPKTGYDRDRFGSGWTVVRGCDMRNRILARDLTDVTYRPGTRRCVVARGTLHDPYTGAAVPFLKGDNTSDDVQVDHR